MQTRKLVLAVVLATAGSAVGAPLQADAWRREYSAAEAVAPHVLALWQFTRGAELEDSSGRGHRLELVGAKPVEAGRFGGGLQSYPGWPVRDRKHGAVAKSHRDLSPSGAFTVDLWLKPAGDLVPRANAHLLCKKYVSHHDYQLVLTPEVRGRRRVQLHLGFGEDSESFLSDDVEWPAGVWQHLAVTYDGAGGVRFYRNGEPIGEKHAPGRRSISPGPLALTLGDRTGSLHSGFSGTLDQVRLSRGVREFGPARLELDLERRVYLRQEPAPHAVIRAVNLWGENYRLAKVVATLGGQKLGELTKVELKPGEALTREVLVDTSLRPDDYDLRLEFTAQTAEGKPIRSVRHYPLRIVARSVPDRFPVVMWGIGGDSEIVRQLPRLKEIGFTHCLGLSVDQAAIWKTGKAIAELPEARRAVVTRVMDEALAQDLRVVLSLSPGHTLESLSPDYRRVDRNGKPNAAGGINGLYPEVEKFCEKVGESAGKLYARYPAFAGALIHTETRDGATLSFGEVDRAAYRKATGKEIPAEVSAKWGVEYRTLANFPKDRIVPDDHPILAYYRWYWREGDGWPGLNSAVARGLRAAGKGAGRGDLWTFHDPAVRVASVYGSGGEVDTLSQWTYSYPDPLRIGLPTDELFAMARGSGRAQSVMKMTQIIWYRSQTAPQPGKGSAPVTSPGSAWDDHDPTAQYITIAPMHLREAFWTKISRPIQGIMYHGWESLVPNDSGSAYRYTHPQTQRELGRLIREVVEPYGPMLRRVPGARHDVAFLESFASQMLARRGSYGWSHGWSGDCYQVLQRAGLQADVLYDETIRREGLDGYKVLVLADCDVLTRTVADAIRAFQKRGGIVVGDERLAPAIRPDILLRSMTRTKKADLDRAEVIARARELRAKLAGKYAIPAESDNPEVVVYRRACSGEAGARYLFVVNDRREFVDYVGRFGLTQENGRASQAKVRLRGVGAEAAVYDLRRSQRVDAVVEKEEAAWPVNLGPCDGGMYVITTRPIAGLHLEAPGRVARGQRLECRIEVRDAGKQALNAVVPLRVELRDPDGRLAEYSGAYATSAGKATLRFDLAANDQPGHWHLRVKELASGRSVECEIEVGARMEAGRP